MLKMSFLTQMHAQKRLRHSSTMSSMTLCFRTIPDTDQALLQFIDVIHELGTSAAAFLLIVKWVQVCACGWPKIW